MKPKNLIGVLALLGCTYAFGGVKENFINEVKTQCKKSDDEAAKLATGGRQGNVMKWKTCTSASVTVGDCTLTCTDSSSKIGG